MDESYSLLTKCVKSDFKEVEISFSEFEHFTDALEKLVPIISHLLDHDFQRLLQIMYRIDIDEAKLKSALADIKPAKEISRLIIERELQKVKTRLYYRSQQ